MGTPQTTQVLSSAGRAERDFGAGVDQEGNDGLNPRLRRSASRHRGRPSFQHKGLGRKEETLKMLVGRAPTPAPGPPGSALHRSRNDASTAGEEACDSRLEGEEVEVAALVACEDATVWSAGATEG